MQRWHLTAGLTGAALLAAMVAPRLAALHHTAPEPPPPLPASTEPPLPASAAPGHLTVDARLDRSAVLTGTSSERFLAVTLTAAQLEGDEGAWVRRPVDLAVVLDASGSMAARGKIDHAKRAAKLLASSMGPDDVYSLVVFSDDATTVVPATRVDDPAAIHRAIDRVYEGGGTNLFAGLERGAHEIRRSLETTRAGAVGQVVLLSDGNANIGVTDPDVLARHAATLANQGITVSTVGLGLDYNEDVLARIGDMGGGSYNFVDDARELESVFASVFERSASVIARNVAVNLSLPAGVELIELIGWDATRTETGWTVWMGDVYAGETRKIVARVRVPGSGNGEMDVASVRADYHDLIEGLMSRSHATATATITSDPEAVAASLDASAAEAATRAWGNWHMDMSTRAYAKGDVKESKRLLAEGRSVLEAAARQLRVPSLAEEADDLRRLGTIYESYEPSSNEGQRAIKGGKEMFRGRAR